MKHKNKNFNKNKQRKSYLANKPPKTTQRELLKKVKDAERAISNHQEIKEDQSLKIKELSYEVKQWRERAEKWEEDARCHLEALDKSEQWKFKQLAHKLMSLNRVRNWTIEYNEVLYYNKIRDLENQISYKVRDLEEKSELMQKSIEELGDERRKNKELQKKLEEKEEILKEFESQLKEQAKQNKELQKQIEKKTLKRKLENTEQEGENKKVKLEKSQELIAKIEAPTK